jgi:hypothetical protein
MAALIVFALPITDTSLAIFRRYMRGQPIFKADNEHIHHEVLRLIQTFNLSHSTTVKLTVIILYIFALIFGITGSLLAYFGRWYVSAFFFAMYGFIFVAAYKSGHRRAISREQADAFNPNTPEHPQPLSGTPTDEHLQYPQHERRKSQPGVSIQKSNGL